MNLAVNARDAMATGGNLRIETGHIELDSSGPLPRGRYVSLLVTDTGCGMDAETVSRLFEPFFTTKERGKGTGLGLSTVYGIVKQSGGHISVESELAKGTVFRILLPSTQEALALHYKQVLASDAHETPTGTETILLVEDEQVVRQLVTQTLQAYGYQVLVAKSGQEAHEIARDHEGTIHLLLSDVVMPNMSGPEVAIDLLRGRPNCRVILMSGYSENPLVQKGSWRKEWAFLQKPVMPSLLARKVREELDQGVMQH